VIQEQQAPRAQATISAPPESLAKVVLRWLLALIMVGIGVLHFVSPDGFVAIVPRALPAPLLLVYVSGVAEIAGGVGILLPRFRRAAGWGLIALYIAVFPANIYMAVNQIQIGAAPLPSWVPWARLPFQAVFMAWAWWVAIARPRPSTQEPPPRADAP
jgi:uncharacterized membrane protein